MQGEGSERKIRHLLDSSSLEGQQTGHELGVHSREVGLRDICRETKRRLLQLRSKGQGECLGQRTQLHLWEAAHPFN